MAQFGAFWRNRGEGEGLEMPETQGKQRKNPEVTRTSGFVSWRRRGLPYRKRQPSDNYATNSDNLASNPVFQRVLRYDALAPSDI